MPAPQRKTAPSSPAPPATGKPVVGKIIHSAVKGRTRIYLSILYRDTQAKDRLEQRLRSNASIHSVQGSVLTGRLLIRHAPELEPRALLTIVLDCARTVISPTATEASARSSGASRKAAPVRGRGKLRIVPSPAPSAWQLLSADRILKTLASSRERGLSTNEVLERLRKYGLNQLDKPERRSDIDILLGQFVSIPVGLLGVSAAVSVLTGGVIDAIAITAVILINAGIGFATERQAEITINALSKITPTDAQVIRDGVISVIPVTHITVGDILILNPGQYVAADARLLRSTHLAVDESALTGESLPVDKSEHFVPQVDTPLSERRNMVYMGTLVTGGSGVAIVVATAYETELGKIQRLVGETRPPETPLQQQLDKMGTQLALLSAAVCGGVFVLGLLRGQSMLQMLKSSISLAVAAVPEGLPTVATTTLALGIRRMHKENVSIRQLTAVETLGSVQVFCLDKTGTLTMNRMSVVDLRLNFEQFAFADQKFVTVSRQGPPADNPGLQRLLEIVALCSDAEMKDYRDARQIVGSPTEAALLEAVFHAGIDIARLRGEHPRLQTQYRSEHRPYMITLHGCREPRRLLAVKGSPFEVLEHCDFHLVDGEVRPLDNDVRQRILAENTGMATQGLRVLGTAYLYTNARTIEHNERLVWVGLIGLADPLRSGMPQLMHVLHEAGIHTVMITGDQSATAYSIGKQLNLSNGRPLQILDSTKLDKLDPNLLSGLINQTHVFARVTPAHKLRIVQTFQSGGQVVAMTGDGINDGPALKAADIGVAMGGAQTDVARSVSDVVVEDDNLMTMVNAIRQGRTIYGNIRKTIRYLLATNMSEIEIMLAGTALGFGQPLAPMQLLWINLITDILPALALSMEASEADIMRRAPRRKSKQIIGSQDMLRISRESGVITLGALGSYMFGRLRYGPGANANTLAFNTLVLAQLLHAVSCRSETHSIFSRGYLPPNPSLNWAIGASLLVQIAAQLVPSMRRLLGIAPVGAIDALAVVTGAAAPLLANDLLKPASMGEIRETIQQKIQHGMEGGQDEQ
jgi:Ca2+-transporting ATPase